MIVRYSVTGSQYSDSVGAMLRPYRDEGTIEAESLPDAVLWLLQHGEQWDTLDVESRIGIEVWPVDKPIR